MMPGGLGEALQWEGEGWTDGESVRVQNCKGIGMRIVEFALFTML